MLNPMHATNVDSLSAALVTAIITLGFTTISCSEVSAATAGQPSDLLKVRALGFTSGAGLAARTRATTEGESNALRIFLETLVGREHLGHVRQIVEDPRLYVQSSRVLGLSEVDGGTSADVEIYVREEALRHDAAILLLPHLPANRTVLIVCREDGPFPGGVSASLVEESLAKTFAANGFTSITSSALVASYSPAELMARVQGEEPTLARLGRENRSDLVVGCSASLQVETSAPGSLVARVKATVSGRVIRAADSARLDVLLDEAAVYGADPLAAAQQALRDGVAKIGTRAVVAGVLGLATRPPTEPYWLTLRQPGSNAVVQAVVSLLRNELDIADVELLRFTPQEARLSFQFNGHTRDLARTLESFESSGFRLETGQVVHHTLVYIVIPR